MQTDFSVHGVFRVRASSHSAISGAPHWINIDLCDKQGVKQSTITIYTDHDLIAGRLLVGLLAQAINDAQARYEASLTQEKR